MKKFTLSALLIVILFSFNSVLSAQKSDTLTVVFWNVENLFDTTDDPIKQDEEFLPDGNKEWTDERLENKMYKIAQVVTSLNNFNGPDVLGLCEVENEQVLTSLVDKYLKGYSIAYKESPDNRGIDVGLIFKSDKFKLVSIKADTVNLPDKYPTRLVLKVKLKYGKKEMSFYVNHWPSRRGGEEQSEKNRVAAAVTLQKMVTREFDADKNANIVIMGDFNDEPGNKSILETLNAIPFQCDSLDLLAKKNLYNISYAAKIAGLGSYKYQDNWNLIDQMIISTSLLNGKEVRYICDSFKILKPDIMVTKSGKFQGTPFPTYAGNRYLGGYSDHFPIELKLLVKNKVKKKNKKSE